MGSIALVIILNDQHEGEMNQKQATQRSQKQWKHHYLSQDINQIIEGKHSNPLPEWSQQNRCRTDKSHPVFNKGKYNLSPAKTEKKNTNKVCNG